MSWKCTANKEEFKSYYRTENAENVLFYKRHIGDNVRCHSKAALFSGQGHSIRYPATKQAKTNKAERTWNKKQHIPKMNTPQYWHCAFCFKTQNPRTISSRLTSIRRQAMFLIFSIDGTMRSAGRMLSVLLTFQWHFDANLYRKCCKTLFVKWKVM